NPAKDNGIKLLGAKGFKLGDEEEDEIEDLIKRLDTLERPCDGEVGRIYHCEQEAEDAYADYLVSLADVKLDDLKLVLDCANGASYRIAPRVFKALGANAIVLNAEPDGLNINRGCGSTHLEQLQQKVKEERAQLGLAFDGDADRCLAVDENGQTVDGDPLLLIFARYLRSQERLSGDCLVTTVMANIGLEDALRREKISMVRTSVGDRYVLAEMQRLGSKLGGEQSGHIIFLDHATTGDGVLTGLMLSQVMAKQKKSLSALAADFHKTPQLLVNVRVADKNRWRETAEAEEAVKNVEQALSGRGRLLIRPSGTENLLRLMAEGPDLDELEGLLQRLKAVFEKYCPAADEKGGQAEQAPDIASSAQDLMDMASEIKKTKALLAKCSQKGDWDAVMSSAKAIVALADKLKSWSEAGRRQAQAWEDYVKNARSSVQRLFAAELREGAQEIGWECSTITLSPPEYRLGRFTVLVHFAKGQAELQYCRMPLATAAVDAAQVIEAAQQAERLLNGGDFDAERCFADMLVAYKRRLVLEGKALGDRVNLVDLVPELAFLRQLEQKSKRRKTGGSRPYDKVQFAWNLLRTWHELHGLECHGRRLNLGTATINSTKNKQNVLFLDEGGTHGQYYLSVWFTK
ncbi:hypothetical protein IJT17_00765, partial [bacterium]|nr:hypothetical protein [bacterium]